MGDLVERVASRREAQLVELVEKLRMAISWLESPCVDEKTSPDELRHRIRYCVEDAQRALATSPIAGER